MTTPATSGTPQPVKENVGNRDGFDWNTVLPRDVVSEDRMSDVKSKEIWGKLYKTAGMTTAGEADRAALRAAIYVYCCLNGTSREGDYAGTFVLSNGKSVEAAILPNAAGKMNIRKFMRANMEESYRFFKTTRVMESHSRYVAKAAMMGIAPENAFAMADWMGEHPMFTPSESKAHNATFVKSIERARRAREGKTLEVVEDERMQAAVNVNGPAYESHSQGDNKW